MVYGELVYFNGTKNTFHIHVCDICWATHAGVCDSTAVTRNMLQDFIGKKNLRRFSSINATVQYPTVAQYTETTTF